jgi:glycosyltransferase involved in cell wall biosynthesis
MIHYKIIIPFYNVNKWIKTTINSVKNQTYDNFECILINDMSTDQTEEIALRYINKDNRFKIINNLEKKYALQNYCLGIEASNPKQENIIINIDGDDWLHNSKVLEILNNYYEKNDCLMTYGSYNEFPNNNVGKYSKQIPNYIINNNLYRNYEWSSSHLRTYKYCLWNKIDKKDFLDSSGQFYKITCDLAIMFPMLEMAGHKAKYIKEILYTYNITNPLNDHKLNDLFQIQIEKEIRSKPKYKELNDI